MKDILIVIAVTATALFILNGCNNDNDYRAPVEPGDQLVVTEQVQTNCDEPITFKASGKFLDTNVSVENNETVEMYNEEWGVDITYVVVTPCEEKDACILPLECDEGFEIVNDLCLPVRYIPFKDDECMDNYKLRKKLGFCKLQEIEEE
jgi:hypothetical protein